VATAAEDRLSIWRNAHFVGGSQRSIKPSFHHLSATTSPSSFTHWLELKRGAAPLTEAQQAFIAQLDSRAVPWAVARDYDGAVRQLRTWGVVK
jgi:hypothetical protein